MKWEEDKEYIEIIKDILYTPQVQLLKQYVQHYNSNRLKHSIDVSYLSYKIAIKLKLNYKSVARAGLLHDLFYYDWRDTKFELGTHAFIHSRVAIRNAKKITNLSDMEKDIILKHMWGLTIWTPHFKETILVDLIDDWIAIKDFFDKK